MGNEEMHIDSLKGKYFIVSRDGYTTSQNFDCGKEAEELMYQAQEMLETTDLTFEEISAELEIDWKY